MKPIACVAGTSGRVGVGNSAIEGASMQVIRDALMQIKRPQSRTYRCCLLIQLCPSVGKKGSSSGSSGPCAATRWPAFFRPSAADSKLERVVQ